MAEIETPGVKLKTKSSTGTSISKLSELSAVEICRIIRESAKSGVEQLTLGSLHIKFCPEGKLGQPKLDSNISSLASPPETKADSSNLVLTSLDEESMRDALESQILLEDPHAYEQAIIDSHLEEGRLRGDNADEATQHWGSQ